MLRTGMRLLSPVLLAGCIVMQSGAASAEAPTHMPSSSEQAVLAFEAEVMNSYNGGDAALAARHYAADAFVFIPGQPVTRGRASIAANIVRFMQDANFKLGYKNERVSVAVSNDLAHTRGKLQVTYTDPKTRAARTITSNYLLVMRRDPQFSWQVVEDISF
jgi:ketosteroid isomerase-like protein